MDGDFTTRWNAAAGLLIDLHRPAGGGVEGLELAVIDECVDPFALGHDQTRNLDDPFPREVVPLCRSSAARFAAGWSKAWKINFRARLHDGDRARKMLGELLVGSILPSRFDAQPPFETMC